jgi:hypothetical protein
LFLTVRDLVVFRACQEENFIMNRLIDIVTILLLVSVLCLAIATARVILG